jgi:hypothetical protein
VRRFQVSLKPLPGLQTLLFIPIDDLRKPTKVQSSTKLQKFQDSHKPPSRGGSVEDLLVPAQQRAPTNSLQPPAIISSKEKSKHLRLKTKHIQENHNRDQIHARTDKRMVPFIRSSKRKSIPKNTPTHPRSSAPVSLNNRLPQEGRKKSPRNARRRMSRNEHSDSFPFYSSLSPSSIPILLRLHHQDPGYRCTKGVG